MTAHSLDAESKSALASSLTRLTLAARQKLHRTHASPDRPAQQQDNADDDDDDDSGACGRAAIEHDDVFSRINDDTRYEKLLDWLCCWFFPSQPRPAEEVDILADPSARPDELPSSNQGAVSRAVLIELGGLEFLSAALLSPNDEKLVNVVVRAIGYLLQCPDTWRMLESGLAGCVDQASHLLQLVVALLCDPHSSDPVAHAAVDAISRILSHAEGVAAISACWGDVCAQLVKTLVRPDSSEFVIVDIYNLVACATLASTPSSILASGLFCVGVPDSIRPLIVLRQSVAVLALFHLSPNADLVLAVPDAGLKYQSAIPSPACPIHPVEALGAYLHKHAVLPLALALVHEEGHALASISFDVLESWLRCACRAPSDGLWASFFVNQDEPCAPLLVATQTRVFNALSLPIRQRVNVQQSHPTRLQLRILGQLCTLFLLLPRPQFAGVIAATKQSVQQLLLAILDQLTQAMDDRMSPESVYSALHACHAFAQSADLSSDDALLFALRAGAWIEQSTMRLPRRCVLAALDVLSVTLRQETLTAQGAAVAPCLNVLSTLATQAFDPTIQARAMLLSIRIGCAMNNLDAAAALLEGQLNNFTTDQWETHDSIVQLVTLLLWFILQHSESAESSSARDYMTNKLAVSWKELEADLQPTPAALAQYRSLVSRLYQGSFLPRILSRQLVRQPTNTYLRASVGAFLCCLLPSTWLWQGASLLSALHPDTAQASLTESLLPLCIQLLSDDEAFPRRAGATCVAAWVASVPVVQQHLAQQLYRSVLGESVCTTSNGHPCSTTLGAMLLECLDLMHRDLDWEVRRSYIDAIVHLSQGSSQECRNLASSQTSIAVDGLQRLVTTDEDPVVRRHAAFALEQILTSSGTLHVDSLQHLRETIVDALRDTAHDNSVRALSDVRIDALEELFGVGTLARADNVDCY
ncbi:hypothetical protein CAOG_03635 [Capsaspora owczarzaki ATCC 30864]|uniref:Uncharacterized protein n=1 Tax=Capsaspora owczarzaki (strain ATCC 30864) TaxID=595528 RepID=A0A0D2WNK2_CAPO3|nr:hypothetical protein CAOG_03635 [Capsaspora owczarzaki ATCC 30864]KJE92720.1 hypothetical protein CAOG_003635 [Capsaspora owczarzaki ATCC 30864]|eukprot:XP_004363363.1 hypothetical protein CAOG_03635 [Capsaspora owczarzaki ATCC 30864]